jgi:uncharacterized repeat protein (TIGR01451 family)
VFDSAGTPMIVWSSASNAGLDYYISPIQDVLDAMDTADLVYSRKVGGVWSAPSVLTSATGRDEQPSLAAGPGGEITVAWINETAGSWTLYASIWNGSTWSSQWSIAAPALLSTPTVAYRGGTPFVLWAQDDDGDLETWNDWALYASTWSGSAWSAPEPAGVSLNPDPARPVPVGGSNRGLVPLPDPPAHCCTASCDDPIPADPPADQQEELDSESTPIIFSIDPNEKTGPAGVGDDHFIDAGDRLDYVVYFENLPAATAPAQEVFVTDCLDHDLDWTSVTLDDVAFGDVIVGNDGGDPLFDARVTIPDYRPGETKDWWVDIITEFDLGTGCLDVTFRTLDPVTGELPEDAFAGFLPPEDGSGRGQGHISLSVDSKEDLVDGTVITNRGTIIFDVNESIVTNEVLNTIGSLLPSLPFSDGFESGDTSAWSLTVP